MEQQTDSKLGKEYIKAIYGHPAYWAYMQSISSASLKMPVNLENSSVATGLKKVSFLFNPKERQCQRIFKLPPTALISHASKVMLKILQARLQQYVNFLMFRLVLEKEPEIKLPTSTGSWKNEESSKETSTSALLTMPKPLTVWATTNCGKFWKRWEYQTTWPASWETSMQVRKQ